jgi:hypothetical protein
MGNVTSDVGTMFTKGKVTSEVGANPGTENVTCSCAGAKYGTEGTTDVTITAQLMAACDVQVDTPGGTCSMDLPGSLLLLLLRCVTRPAAQDADSEHLQKYPLEATLQLPARADGNSPPGPSAQPVNLNTIPAPQEWILGESSLGPKTVAPRIQW